MKKHLLISLLSLLSFSSAWADVEFDGICYTVNGNNATVIKKIPSYTGDVIIPATFSYNGISFNVIAIDEYAFKYCSGLTSITIPEGVSSIGNSAFENCTGLTNIIIPEGVSSIGNSAFENCTGLTNIIIPEGVTSIGNSAFCDCSGLTNIIIPESVKSIGASAFRNCSGLTSITIPGGITSIGSKAFDNSPWYNNQPDGVIYIGSVLYQYKGTMPENNSITIKDGTTAITDYAFSDCTGLTNIIIPESVKSIGAGAFCDCSGLTSITIPGGITSIGSKAFDNSPWYNNQPDGVIYIGSVLYQYKGTMPENNSITIKDGTTAIADYAFNDCKKLANITIPASVSTIGSYAFYKCTGLTNIIIPEGVTSIGRSAFHYCSKLTSLTIPASVSTIGSFAFWGCTSLASVTISEGVKSIGDAAFAQIENLKSITIPSTVREIGSGAFSYSRKIENVYISDIDAWCKIRFGHNMVNNDLSNQGSSPVCGHLLLNGKEVTEVIFPEGTTSISPYALSGCSNITSITIPNSVVEIGLYAFYGCSNVTSVVIPCGVNLIPKGVFYGCKLEKIVLKGSNTTTNSITSDANFSQDTYNHATLYVPMGSKWDMIYEKGWRSFINIREMADEKEELSDVKAYTLMNTKTMGYVVYDDVNDNTRSIQDVDENAANNSWQIIDANGNKCLYNIGAKKFASIKSDGNIALSEKPVALSMENGKDGIIIDNISSSEWNFVLNEKINIDEHVTGIESITTSDSPANVYYDLNGRKLDGVPTQKGVYIQNGKKVVIK